LNATAPPDRLPLLDHLPVRGTRAFGADLGPEGELEGAVVLALADGGAGEAEEGGVVVVDEEEEGLALEAGSAETAVADLRAGALGRERALFGPRGSPRGSARRCPTPAGRGAYSGREGRRMAFKDRPFFRRTLELDDLLRQGRRVTATTLAGRWETSTKTVQRFIDLYRNEFGAPVGWDARAGTYRYEDPSWHLPWLEMEGRDLFTVGVAMKVLQMYRGTPVARDMKAIFDRLSKLMPAEVRISPSSFVEKLYVRPQAQRPVEPKVWDAVATALREKVALAIDYQKPDGTGRQREVEPFHLVLAGQDWFLLARDPEDGVVKTFYLARMRSAAVGTRRFAPPKGFRPEEHFGDTIGLYVGKPRFRFTVRFDAEVAGWISEVAWHEKQKLTRREGGGVDLELPAGSLLEARRFVLSFGRHALAVAPEELVEDVRSHLAALAAAYRIR